MDVVAAAIARIDSLEPGPRVSVVASFAEEVVVRALHRGVSDDRFEHPEVAQSTVGDAEVRPLLARLAEWIGSNLASAGIGPMVWVLGKSHQPEFRALYLRVLGHHVGEAGDPGALYQALIALDNLDELPRYTSWAAHDVEENRRRARELLDDGD